MGSSRDFGTEGAGKGDSDRTTDRAAFERNFDKINWGREKPDLDPKIYGNPFPEPHEGPDTEPGFDFNAPTTDIIRE